MFDFEKFFTTSLTNSFCFFLTVVLSPFKKKVVQRRQNLNLLMYAFFLARLL